MNKIGNLAIIFVMLSTITFAKPIVLQTLGQNWKENSYSEKISYVNDLYEITSVNFLPVYISMNDKEFAIHSLSPEFMTLRLDAFYLFDNNWVIPVWLAMLNLENKLTKDQVVIVLSKLVEKSIIWMEE